MIAGNTISSSTTLTNPRDFVREKRRDHLFFTLMAFAMTAGVFGGFWRSYFAKSYFHSPALPFWVHVHGAVFTAWILFYLLQNVLVLAGITSLHRKLGIVGGMLAAGVFVMGIAITVRQVRGGNFFPFPDQYSDLLISMAQMTLFAAFVGIGLWLRKDSQTHKRLIMMAVQFFFFPAFGRLLQGINLPTLLLALAFYLAGPIYDLITKRRIHPAYRWGVPLLILTMPPFAGMASQAPVWRWFVDRFVM